MVVFPAVNGTSGDNDWIKHHKGQSMAQPRWLGLA
jgi:hypothetical protein